MIAAPLADVATVVQFETALQMTQSEAFDFIHSDSLLASSLWTNVALAGVSILLFVYMGRNIEGTRAQLIWVATLLVPLVSLSSYLGLVSGLTVGFLEMPAGHALAGEGGVFSPWGRYLTWALSTPMILTALGLLAGTDRAKLFTAITMDVGMCVTGLAAALTTGSYLLRWVFYALSCAFFVAVLYVLLVEWPADAAAAGTAEIFNTLKTLTVVLWLGYPILWALGSEGFAVLGVGVTSWGYSGLDILAKYVFAFLLLRWVAANQNVVGRETGATEQPSSGTPADD
ncbi:MULTISPECIES: bacteriorhodopsin [Salinibaculum]|uniref:bacteriorhodopsin n=1 Tax=Salinibaculum TaxID=2732368 RepID=UPI0030CFF690